MTNLIRFEAEIPARARRPEEDFLGTETVFEVGFKAEVANRASDALAAPISGEPEQGDILASPSALLAAPVARDALTVALARVTAFSSDKAASVDSIDLDAIDSRFHAGRCVCMACSNDRVGPDGDSATPLSGGATAAPAPAASMQTLADYLRVGYWQAAGTVSRLYNLGTNGNNPNAGEIRYNLSGWNGDTNGLDTTARRDMAREAFKLFQAVLGIRFVETTATDTSVDIFFTDNDLGSAYAYVAGNSYSNGVDYSVINVSRDWYSSLSGFDTYTHQTYLHEIGHVLGLGHQGLYNGSGAYSTDAQFANDSWQASMMSYFSQTQNPTTGASYAFLQTAMSVDWLALDDIYRSYDYGISNAFNGDTVYGVNTTITAAVSRIFNEFSVYADTTAYTIVDASGYDTIDVSNFSADQQINLAPSQAASTIPSISNIGGKIGNLTLAVGTVIEAAIGGAGNDSFFGNAAANTFRGGGGNDSFTDSFGSDVYFGDDGTDWLYFSESIDLLRYELSGDSLLFSRNLDSTDVYRVWNGLENLSFNSVVYSYQQLVDSLAGPPPGGGDDQLRQRTGERIGHRQHGPGLQRHPDPGPRRRPEHRLLPQRHRGGHRQPHRPRRHQLDLQPAGNGRNRHAQLHRPRGGVRHGAPRHPLQPVHAHGRHRASRGRRQRPRNPGHHPAAERHGERGRRHGERDDRQPHPHRHQQRQRHLVAPVERHPRRRRQLRRDRHRHRPRRQLRHRHHHRRAQHYRTVASAEPSPVLQPEQSRHQLLGFGDGRPDGPAQRHHRLRWQQFLHLAERQRQRTERCGAARFPHRQPR